MAQNPFIQARNQRNLSIRKLSQETGIDRRKIQAVESEDLESISFEAVVKLARHLDINLVSFIRSRYGFFPGDIYEEEMDELVNRLVWIQMDLISKKLSEFALKTKTRVDDFDLGAVLSNKSNLNRLIALVIKLETGRISINEALKEFPAYRKQFNRRKSIKQES